MRAKRRGLGGAIQISGYPIGWPKILDRWGLFPAQVCFAFPAATGLWKEIVMRLRVWTAILVVFAMAGPPLLANTITFSTTGDFASNSGNSFATYGAGSSAITLTFTGNNADVGSPASVSLGSFKATGGDASDVTASDTFTLSIAQTNPSVGPGVFTGTVSGTIAVDHGLISVLFSPAALSIGDVRYTLQSNPIIVPVPTDNAGASIQATVAVPLPPAVWAGLSLMGLMGIKGYRRQRLIKAGE